MPVIQSEIDVHGTAFAQNRETMLATIAGFMGLTFWLILTGINLIRSGK